MPFRDTIAPQMPAGLKGKVDSNGIVKLTWDSNPEADVAGYFIYRANSDKHVFTNILVKPVNAISYSDTISMKTLTEKIYYKITAVDYYGHVSEFSKMLVLERPDRIAPTPPSITTYSLDERKLTIDWKPSRSKDVVKHVVYKKMEKEPFKIYQTFTGPIKSIIDTSLRYGQLYEYKIIAVDDAGLSSVETSRLNVTPVNKNLPGAVQLIRCEIDAQGQLSLEWSDKTTTGHQYIIYSSVQGGKMEVFDRISNKTTYSKKLPVVNDYVFAVKSVDVNGKKSKFSNTMKINYK